MHRRRASLALAIVGLLAFAPLAAGHGGGNEHGGWRTFILNAHDAETENGTLAWFTIDNGTTPNPAIPIHPGDVLFFTLVNRPTNAYNHSLSFGAPLDASTEPISPGNETSIEVTIPTNATNPVVYEDPAWRNHGMQGTLTLDTTDRTNTTPTPALGPLLLSLLVLGASLPNRRNR